ncbi:MAG: hypothetical protein OXG79_12400 [Chloroflexi bacterium]|nr:hypothetical protein [Chloroflexota bacterium]
MITSYLRDHCRCDLCQAAFDAIAHGTWKKYSYGCRCMTCRAAAREKSRQRRADPTAREQINQRHRARVQADADYAARKRKSSRDSARRAAQQRANSPTAAAEFRASKRAYREANRQRINAASRARRQRIKTSDPTRYAAILASARQWRRDNPERARANDRRKWQRLRQSPGGYKHYLRSRLEKRHESLARAQERQVEREAEVHAKIDRIKRENTPRHLWPDDWLRVEARREGWEIITPGDLAFYRRLLAEDVACKRSH